MRYWEEMNGKYGFDDGDAEPPDARTCRMVYVQALNALAAKKNCMARAVAYNRPGVHNACLILVVPVELFQTLTAAQVLGEDDWTPPDDFREVRGDTWWSEIVAEIEELDVDRFVETRTAITPEFQRFLNTLSVEE